MFKIEPTFNLLDPKKSADWSGHWKLNKTWLFENIVGKAKMLVTSIFSFSHNVVYSIKKTHSIIWGTFELSSLNAFILYKLKILSFGQEPGK